jgi:hypothetical protein
MAVYRHPSFELFGVWLRSELEYAKKKRRLSGA